MSCRYTLDVLLAGEDAPWSARRHLAETCFIVFGSLGVAFVFPTAAEKIFAVTGAQLPNHVRETMVVCIRSNMCNALPLHVHAVVVCGEATEGNMHGGLAPLPSNKRERADCRP